MVLVRHASSQRSPCRSYGTDGSAVFVGTTWGAIGFPLVLRGRCGLELMERFCSLDLEPTIPVPVRQRSGHIIGKSEFRRPSIHLSNISPGRNTCQTTICAVFSSSLRTHRLELHSRWAPWADSTPDSACKTFACDTIAQHSCWRTPHLSVEAPSVSHLVPTHLTFFTDERMLLTCRSFCRALL